MVCSSCGYKNVNESAPFCGGCGKPLGVARAFGDQGSPSTDHLTKSELHHARKSSKLIVVIATFLVCSAIAGVGLVILHRPGVVAQANATPKTIATKAFSTPVSAGAASPAPAAPILASDSPPASQTPGATTATAVRVKPSALIPSGTNIAALDFGGE